MSWYRFLLEGLGLILGYQPLWELIIAKAKLIEKEVIQEKKYIIERFIFRINRKKEFFSCVWRPNDEEISCNESDVDSLRLW